MRTIIQKINKISELSLAVLMWMPWVLMLIIMWEVILRSLFNKPTTWAHEMSSMVFGCMVMISGAYALRYTAHVNMDLFYNLLPKRGRALIDMITFPLFLIFIVVLFWFGWEFALRSYKGNEVSLTDWAPMLWPIKFTIPIGTFLMLIQGLANFLSNLYILITGKGVDE